MTAKPATSLNQNPTSPLREARIRAGLSREKLAVKIGRSVTTLYWAERAPGTASDEVLQAISKALGVPVEELR